MLNGNGHGGFGSSRFKGRPGQFSKHFPSNLEGFFFFCNFGMLAEMEEAFLRHFFDILASWL